jgi:hypothetical protein
MMATRSWAGYFAALLAIGALAQGCGQVITSSSGAGGGGEGDAKGTSGNDDAGYGGGAGGKPSSGAGVSQGGNSSGGEARGDGGAGRGGAADAGAGTGGDSAGASDGGAVGAFAGAAGESGAGGDGAVDVHVDIEACLASLIGPSTEDAISVRGRAGVLGVVDYAIAGYSAGASGLDGLQRFTNGYYGQLGTPVGISDTGLWMWTQSGPVVVGKVYTSGYDVPGGAQLNFRIYADSYSKWVSCSGWGSGHFTFTQFQVGSLLATGGYDFQCPEAGIDVSGCFRYVF